MYYSYLPKYDELDYLADKYLKDKPNARLNFFLDVKNGIYNHEKDLKENNKLEQSVELIAAVANVIEYIKNRFKSNHYNNQIRFYFFCETGKSSYHRAIDMGYKSNRGLNDYLMRDDNNRLFSEIVFFSIYTLKDIINMIPNAYFFLGEHREFDYIPFVIAKKVFDENDTGIILSTDKDMYQMHSYFDNFEQLEKIPYKAKWHPGRLFINKDNYVERICYKEVQELNEKERNFLKNHFSLSRAIIGDAGDGVTGIKGLQFRTLFKYLDDILDVILPRSQYNETIKKLDFFKFDFKRENSIFDLEKIKDKIEKKELKSVVMKRLMKEESIIRVCKNIALMDYDIMYYRRKQKDSDIIDEVLNFDNKFNSQKDVESFIDKTGLWQKCPGFRICINIE